MTAQAVCPVCPHGCRLGEGAKGRCGARLGALVNGRVQVNPAHYGYLTALALDPIEKKPLARFRPGSLVLSAGGCGCNLRCPFCQNHEIAQPAPGKEPPGQNWTPEELARRALELVPRGNIGLAFTYNEPAVCWEFVRDAAHCAKALGLASVMVTNGFFSDGVLDALLPDIDAFNIDLKCFTPSGYRELGGGETGLETVKAVIAKAARYAHVEVTCLAVPGLFDEEADIERAAAWLAGISPRLPLHISRYFPRWRMKAPPTPTACLEALARAARRRLEYVYLGNV